MPFDPVVSACVELRGMQLALTATLTVYCDIPSENGTLSVAPTYGAGNLKLDDFAADLYRRIVNASVSGNKPLTRDGFQKHDIIRAAIQLAKALDTDVSVASMASSSGSLLVTSASP